MRLFHSSVTEKEVILKEGLKGNLCTSVSVCINTALRENGFVEIADIRDNAVFLTDTSIKEARTILSVDINDLDESKLFIASEATASKIFALRMTGRTTTGYCEVYSETFMPYKEYSEKAPYIKRPEFIYLGDIPADKLKFVRENIVDENMTGTNIYVKTNDYELV